MAIKLTASFYAAVAFLAMPVHGDQLSGTVSDPEGLAIPGAEVTIRCAERRESTKSDLQGRFTFKAVPPDECSLLVKHSGFALFEQQLGPGMRLFPVRLQLAEVKDRIDVVGDVEKPSLSERTINSVSLSDEELKTISNNTQDWIRYAKLVAGATFGSDTIYVDGLPATSLPPAEMVARISVNADPFSAEYADGDSTHIDIMTKGADRTFGLSFSGLSFGAGGRNPLSLGLRPRSSSGQGDFNGFIPHFPVTFVGHIDVGKRVDQQPILAVLPASVSQGPLKASVGNSSISGSIDTFYVRENLHAHASFYDSRSYGSNLGAGGITLPEAGIDSRHDSRELRATVNDGFERFFYLGGLAITETGTSAHANSTAAGVTVPGAFIDGGSPLTNSSSYGTHWTLKNVFQSASAPSSWTTGLTVSGEDDSKQNIPNAAGSFTFPDLQAYMEAQAGLGTGTWVLMRGNGAASYSGVSASPFVQKTILHSKRAVLTAGLRADYQSGFRIMASPRISAAAEWRGFVFRVGGGLFVKDITANIFLRALDGDSTHLQETIVTGVSLLNGVAGSSSSIDGLIHSQLAADLVRPRELMQKASIERRLGKVSIGAEYTWMHGWHLLGSRRLPDADGWADLLESNRLMDRERLHSQVRYTFRRLSLTAHYEWIISRDDTAGPFSFPANQQDIRAEWARTAGAAPNNVNLVGSIKLPGGTALTATNSWRGSAPYNITTGLDPANNGLYTDRGGRPRNTGNGPDYNSLAFYAYKRIPVPRLRLKGRQIYLDLGIHAENVFNNRDYTSLGTVIGSPTFGQPLTALPGRAVRFWLNFD